MHSGKNRIRFWRRGGQWTIKTSKQKNIKVYRINVLKQHFECQQSQTESGEAIQCLNVICSQEENVFDEEMISLKVFQNGCHGSHLVIENKIF